MSSRRSWRRVDAGRKAFAGAEAGLGWLDPQRSGRASRGGRLPVRPQDRRTRSDVLPAVPPALEGGMGQSTVRVDGMAVDRDRGAAVRVVETGPHAAVPARVHRGAEEEWEELPVLRPWPLPACRRQGTRR